MSKSVAGSLATPTYPWSPAGDIAANCAIGALRINLQRQLTFAPDNAAGLLPGINAPTIMAAIGAITGYASQIAAAACVLSRTHPRQGNDLFKIQTTNGETFYFGDQINKYLVPDPQATLPLYGFLAGAAVSKGVPAAELPDYRVIMRRQSKNVGTPQFGTLEVPPEHAPLLPTRQLFDLVWPTAIRALGEAAPEAAGGGKVDLRHWPFIASIVAQQLLIETSSVMPPQLAMSVALESALAISKIQMTGPDASPLVPLDAALFGPGTPLPSFMKQPG